LTTDDGYQIPLLPVSKDVDGIIDVIPGAQVDVGKGGETTITSPDGEDSNTIVGIFDPIVMTSDEPPGIYRTGEGADQEATIVYHDGTLQRLLPTIQSPDEFTQAAKDIPDVGDVKINVDGSITINYQGADVTLKPLFDIESSSADGTLTPMITIEDGKFYFSNSDGDKQELQRRLRLALMAIQVLPSHMEHSTLIRTHGPATQVTQVPPAPRRFRVLRDT